MELAEAFKFLTILSESFKLIFKTLKHISAIAAIAMITPSVLILLFCFSFQFLMTKDLSLVLWAIIPAEIVFLLAFIPLSIFIRVSTILVSATSYSGKTIPLQEVFPIFKSTFKMQRKTNFYGFRRAIPFAIVMGIVIVVVELKPRVIIIAIAALIGVACFIYQLYLSVVSCVAMVVSVVEQDCYAKDAVKRATELVEGQQIHGFLMNMFLNLVFLLGFGSYWIATGDIAQTNLIIFVFVMLNLSFLFQIFILVAYTVFYFECRKSRGENIESVVVLSMQYSKLSTVETA